MVALNTIGLLFATATSVTDVVTDVARKKALRNNPLLLTAFLTRVFIAITASAIFAIHWTLYHPVDIHFAATESAFVLAQHPSPSLVFFLYLLLDTSLVTITVVLYFRALQVSPMSLCVPFLAFTPVFLLATGYLFLKERTSWEQMEGVAFVVMGSLVMNRELFRKGWLEPLRALAHQEGARDMLIVSFIFALTNPLDKRLVKMSDPFFQSWAYAMMLVLLLGSFILGRRGQQTKIVRSSWGWIVLAGMLDASALLLQFFSHKYIDVVITITIKRAGIVLAVLFGWLIFHEREIPDRLIAASVMVAGALMLYMPMSAENATIFSATVLVAMTAALLLIRPRPAPETDAT